MGKVCIVVWSLSAIKSGKVQVIMEYSKFLYQKISYLFCMLGNFSWSFVSADFFFQILTFSKFLTKITSVFWTVWIQIRPILLLDLILVQTVCKGYHQTTKLIHKLLRVAFNCHRLNFKECTLKIFLLKYWNYTYFILQPHGFLWFQLYFVDPTFHTVLYSHITNEHIHVIFTY